MAVKGGRGGERTEKKKEEYREQARFPMDPILDPTKPLLGCPGNRRHKKSGGGREHFTPKGGVDIRGS